MLRLLGRFVLVDIPCRVNERSIQQRRYDEDNIAGHNERPDGLEIVDAVEGEEGEKDIVDELADQSGEIVPEPEESVSIAAELGR